MVPDVLHVGFLHIRSYGLLLAIAFLVGTWLALREARRLRIDEDKLIGVILVTLVASILGARAMYVLEHVADYQGRWASSLALWQGGLTLYGGLVVGAFAGLLTARRVGLPMWSAADAMAPSAALGTMFGRIGCFLNGCCYGKPTSMPWGVVYPEDSFPGIEFGNTPIHPAQLYFSLAGLVLFIFLWRARKRIGTPGVLFWVFIVSFALIRIPLDLTRSYEANAILTGLGGVEVTQSQFVSLAMVLFGALMILRLRRRAGEAAAAAASAASGGRPAANRSPSSPA